MSCCGLILAAGKGERCSTQRPKQFLQLLGRPLLAWTLHAFEDCKNIDTLVLVVAQEEMTETRKLLVEERIMKPITLCAGGDRRVDSVRCGLKVLPAGTKIVAIHDGARPLVTPKLIEQVVDQARETGAAVAAVGAQDTVKIGVEKSISTLDRSQVWLAQTPQAFNVEIIQKAYALNDDRVGQLQVTDDSQLVEYLGHPIFLVRGERSNFKITVKEEFFLAECILRRRNEKGMKEVPEIATKQSFCCSGLPRMGIGYDVHRLEYGQPFVLGGVKVPHQQGLVGHSDADVLCHAVGDALLGAVALGDLGQHFPPEDPRYRGICSLNLLAEIRKKIMDAGYDVGNVDSVVACEAPRLNLYIKAMRQNVSQVLEIPFEQVSIKATTTEGLGFVGRGEGVAAYATVFVFPVMEKGNYPEFV
ncbi:MAG: 2-C-methyl-D-erythritol 4-phosphate cytidylyltransferase [Pseudomonadota bacterium]